VHKEPEHIIEFHTYRSAWTVLYIYIFLYDRKMLFMRLCGDWNAHVGKSIHKLQYTHIVRTVGKC